MKQGNLIRLKLLLEPGRNSSSITRRPLGQHGEWDVVANMREKDFAIVIEVPEHYTGDYNFGPEDETACLKVALSSGITGWIEGYHVESLT